MTSRLDLYLELERVMLFAEGNQQDDAAEAIRDVMDRIWYSFDDAERKLLDLRTVGAVALIEGIRIPKGPDLFFHRRSAVGSAFPQGSIQDWRLAA